MSTLPLTYYKIGDKCVNRFPVPEDNKDWTKSWDKYNSTAFSIDFTGKPWADPDITDPHFEPKWNQIDGKIDRRSYPNDYRVVNGYPLNPMGRTGIGLRGVLGRWGPNQVADPIVTQWKRNENNEIVIDLQTKRQILQFVAIRRSDTNEWAIPGGMVDAGEEVSATLKREFFEEALNALEENPKKREELETKLKNFFKFGFQTYKGYVEDPRNTDNAWMETVAMHFHDHNGNIIGNIPLKAGDDAIAVQWIDMNSKLKLYANHKDFIQKVANHMSAHW